MSRLLNVSTGSLLFSEQSCPTFVSHPRQPRRTAHHRSHRRRRTPSQPQLDSRTGPAQSLPSRSLQISRMCRSFRFCRGASVHAATRRPSHSGHRRLDQFRDHRRFTHRRLSPQRSAGMGQRAGDSGAAARLQRQCHLCRRRVFVKRSRFPSDSRGRRRTSSRLPFGVE